MFVDVVGPANGMTATAAAAAGGIVPAAGRRHRKVVGSSSGGRHYGHGDSRSHPATHSGSVGVQVSGRSSVRVLELVALGHDRLRFGRRGFGAESAPEGRERARPVARQTAAAPVATATVATAGAASQRFVALHLADDAHVSTHSRPPPVHIRRLLFHTPPLSKIFFFFDSKNN